MNFIIFMTFLSFIAFLISDVLKFIKNKPNFTIPDIEKQTTQDEQAEEEQNIFFAKRAEQKRQERKDILKIYEKRKQKIDYKIKKGREYEYQIFMFFKDRGYKVYPKGYFEGVKDEGIDLLAYKDKETLLVQCKNWKNPPKQNDIKIFAFNCDEYIKKNSHIFKDKIIRKIFITSCQKQDYGVKCFLNDYNSKEAIKIEYISIQNLNK